MSIEENPVFKFVSFRAPLDGLAIDPSRDHEDSDVVVRVRTTDAEPAVLRARVLALLRDRPRLTAADMSAFKLSGVADLLASQGVRSFEALRAAVLDRNGPTIPLADFARTPEYESEYRRLFESWLAQVLPEDAEAQLSSHERLIRVAHLCGRLRDGPEALHETGVVQNLLRARLLLPQQFRRSSRRLALLAERHDRILRESRVRASAIEKEIVAKRKEFVRLSERITTRDAIQRKANDAYWEWKREGRAASAPAAAAPAGSGARRGGLFRSVANFFLGSPTPPVTTPVVSPPADLNDAFYRRLDVRLTPTERDELETALRESAVPRPLRFNALTGEVLDNRFVVDAANDACSAIRVFEEDRTRVLPGASARDPMENRPSVRAIGWGDLIVARERLVGYDAREIAHIENVMAGESRVREHERTRSREEVVETETTSEVESERDLQTTDRYELQTETSKTVNEEFAIEAGVNTSGRYGLTKVETSLDVGFQRSSSEARSSSIKLAKEIVSRAVERVFESVRETRRVTIAEQIRELNRHAIDNSPPEGGPVPGSRSGVYLWVEKIEEVELRHYGSRLMVEFHIPEPAVSLLERDPVQVDVRKPAPFKLGPSDVTEANYLCLTKLFGAQDVEPPPSQFIEVGFSWSSEPDEEVNEGQAEDLISETISIPAGYRPVSGTAHLTSIPIGDSSEVYLYLNVGGVEAVHKAGFKDDAEWDFNPADAWPNGVPVSMAAHGHFDRAMVVQVTLRCQRRAEAVTNWQLRTWERLRQAHGALVRAYEEALEEAEFAADSFELPTGRPAAQNRAVERDELKKWSIKTMRIAPLDFDAIAQVGQHQEVDPLDSDLQAPIVRFFEEAFEWRQMSYFLYPYFWGRRDAWRMRMQLSNPDRKHEDFLRAGAARVVVSVTPGYEDRVLRYLDSDPDESELERIQPFDPEEVPADSDASDLWLEILLNRNEQLALGSGTLRVAQNSTSVTVNDDSTWAPTERDLGRELYIFGTRYFVQEVTGDKQFELNEPYVGADDDAAKYATGSLPFGPPWLERIPTSLVILSDQKAQLPQA